MVFASQLDPCCPAQLSIGNANFFRAHGEWFAAEASGNTNGNMLLSAHFRVKISILKLQILQIKKRERNIQVFYLKNFKEKKVYWKD